MKAHLVTGRNIIFQKRMSTMPWVLSEFNPFFGVLTFMVLHYYYLNKVCKHQIKLTETNKTYEWVQECTLNLFVYVCCFVYFFLW